MRRRWKFRKRTDFIAGETTHPLIISRAIYQEALAQRNREKDVMHSSLQHNLRLRRHFLCSQSVMLHSVNSIQISPGRWFISRELKKAPRQICREWYLSLSAWPKWALFIWRHAAEKAASRARARAISYIFALRFVPLCDFCWWRVARAFILTVSLHREIAM